MTPRSDGRGNIPFFIVGRRIFIKLCEQNLAIRRDFIIFALCNLKQKDYEEVYYWLIEGVPLGVLGVGCIEYSDKSPKD
jgi:hypothetical protein